MTSDGRRIVTVKLPLPLYTQLQMEAARKDSNKGAVIRGALEEYFGMPKSDARTHDE